MIGLTSEITDEVSFGRRDHQLYLCPQMNQAWSSALLKAWHGGILVLYQPSRQGLGLSLQQHTRYISCPFAIFGISSISFPLLQQKNAPTIQAPAWFLIFLALFLLAGGVSLNPGPGVRGLRLGTVNARSMRDKAPAPSDLVASKSIDLLGITETWLTLKKLLQILLIWPSRVSLSFTNLEHSEEGEE